MSSLSFGKLVSTLLYFLGKDKKKFIFWNVPIILSNILSLVEPLFIGLIIDFFTKYSAGQPLSRFYFYLGGLLLSDILAGVMRISARGAMFEVTADLEYTVKTKGFENIQNNSLAWQQGENSGNKVQRIETGKTALIDLIELLKDDLYSTMVNLVGIFTIFIAINPIFVGFFIVYAALQFQLHKYWNAKNPEYLTKLNAAKELSIGKLFEGLSNIQTIKSLGATSSFQSSINTSQNELREATKAWEKLGVRKWISVNIFDICSVVVFFVLVSRSVISGVIGVGFIFVLYTYFDKLQSTTFNITGMWNRLVRIRSNVERMLPLFESSIHNRGDKKFPVNWTSLRLENAGFEYETTKNKVVFKNISLTVDRNSFIGITGESGSGKSSLVKVLLGLYPLKDGVYFIGKTNFYDIASDEVLENMTVVLQDTELFNVSLLENIAMFKDVNAPLLEAAIRVSCLDDVIKTLPEGLDTIIGEKGIKLSGGQRQRIGIARAIYKNSQILLLDEATSNLDYETERIVMEGILSISKAKTIIAVAHRTSTLEKTDKIFKFESGQLTRV